MVRTTEGARARENVTDTASLMYPHEKGMATEGNQCHLENWTGEGEEGSLDCLDERSDLNYLRSNACR